MSTLSSSPFSSPTSATSFFSSPLATHAGSTSTRKDPKLSLRHANHLSRRSSSQLFGESAIQQSLSRSPASLSENGGGSGDFGVFSFSIGSGSAAKDTVEWSDRFRRQSLEASRASRRQKKEEERKLIYKQRGFEDARGPFEGMGVGEVEEQRMRDRAREWQIRRDLERSAPAFSNEAGVEEEGMDVDGAPLSPIIS
ncbi:hypothetical protein BT69DRAFT_897035 [Atractiella rhizophila]|nr:hypothetical protein BT69DRAFT_897035 [Atractiella rhizophila]